MLTERVLLFTDAVDSTRLTEQLGDLAASALWAEHDRVARQLLRDWRGTEIDKSDGFLLMFGSVDDAVAFAQALHEALARLTPPVQTRAGVHLAPMVQRVASDADRALGAKRVELDGVGKAVAARIMSLARGGQTLLSATARAALQGQGWQVQAVGHYRLKGLDEPLALWEVAPQRSALAGPPIDGPKAYRVVPLDDGWEPVAAMRHGLPAERDTFVGRQDALAALAARFDDGARLVTVLGIGGMGKTRLALRYARQWLGDYPGGAWFCDLASARSLDGIAHAVAQGLDVPLGKTDPVQQLAAAIHGRGECLVILDNFEQVARHAEASVGQWLERAPGARFLVTSREVLGVPGEDAFVLAPLAVDEAVRLFERRAKAVDERGVSDEADRAVLPRLADLLDRLPLAIELAAARIRVMSARTMLERMGERFKLLASTGGRRDRQATLRGALDWSWELLSAAEQSVLAQLSVFEGGFTLEAAEAVVSVGSHVASIWVPDVVQSLVEKSLLRSERQGRFGLLSSVQDYAAGHLDGWTSNEPASIASSPWPTRDATQRRHWRHFAMADEQRATADRCADSGNHHVACRRAAPSEPEYAVGALLATWHGLRLTGPFRAGLELVATVESSAELGARERAVADRVAGAALHLLGDLPGARARYATSLACASESRQPLAKADVLCLIADLDTSRGEFAAAESALREALTLNQVQGSLAGRLRALISWGGLCLRRSRLGEARAHYTQALALAEMLGDRRRQGGVHGNLGLIEQLQGHAQEARDHYDQALTLSNDVGDRQWEGNTRCNLGLLLHELGEPLVARQQLTAALQVAQAIGHRRLEATTLCNLGLVAGSLGDDTDALCLHTNAVAAARALGDRQMLGQFLGYLGLALAGRQRSDDAEQCFDEGAQALAGFDDPATLGLLLCQRARAAAQRGDEALRQRWCDAAEALFLTAPPDPGSELAGALELARRPA